MHVTQELADKIISLAQLVDEKVLSVYERDFDVYEKADKSPLTEADLLSHEAIVKGSWVFR